MLNRPSKNNKRTSPGYWQSYSDMMAALLLMFILIMAYTLVQSLNTFEEKMKTQKEQERLLNERQKELEEQKNIVAQQQKEIDELIGVKSDIIKELTVAFEKTHLKIDLDNQTGAISLDSSILFSYDSWKLSDKGKTFLKDFLPLYISVLLVPKYQNYISEIIIEGHTDTDGDYIYNMNLSQKRAYAVAEFTLNPKSEIIPDDQNKTLRTLFTANGKSYSNPVYDKNGHIDPNKSRRVEIKFRLKDDEMMQRFKEILTETKL